MKYYALVKYGKLVGSGHVYRVTSFLDIIGIRADTTLLVLGDNQLVAVSDIEKLGVVDAVKEIHIMYSIDEAFDKVEAGNVVILDGYDFDIEIIENKSNELELKTIFIADIHKQIPTTTVLINHLPYSCDSYFPELAIKKKLIGPRYAILRKPFYSKSDISPTPETFLICLGNSNVNHCITALYKVLLKNGVLAERIKVLYKGELPELPHGAVISTNDPDKVYKLISESEYCFITPGNISYEVFSIGRKVIMGALTNDQEKVVQLFSTNGLCVDIGRWEGYRGLEFDWTLNASVTTVESQHKLFDAMKYDTLREELSYILK